MTKSEKLNVCKFMYDNNLSLGEVNKEFSISRTRLYEFINNELPEIDRVLYDEIRAQLVKRNKRR